MHRSFLLVTLVFFGAAACATTGSADGHTARPSAGLEEDHTSAFFEEEVSFSSGEVTLIGTLSTRVFVPEPIGTEEPRLPPEHSVTAAAA